MVLLVALSARGRPALLCGVGAVYFGTFLGADAVTAFCLVQAARLAVRALGRRCVLHGRQVLAAPWWDRPRFESVEADRNPVFAIGESDDEAGRGRAPMTEPEPELTLDELIAGDPGAEPDDPGLGWDASIAATTTAGSGEGERIATRGDGDSSPSRGKLVAAGSEAAEALRRAVADRS